MTNFITWRTFMGLLPYWASMMLQTGLYDVKGSKLLISAHYVYITLYLIICKYTRAISTVIRKKERKITWYLSKVDSTGGKWRFFSSRLCFLPIQHTDIIHSLIKKCKVYFAPETLYSRPEWAKQCLRLVAFNLIYDTLFLFIVSRTNS